MKEDKNKHDVEQIRNNQYTKYIVESVERGDDLIKVGEPSQNILNYLSENGYQLVGTYQCGYMDERNGMSYDCIFKLPQVYPSYVVHGSCSGRFDPESMMKEMEFGGAK